MEHRLCDRLLPARNWQPRRQLEDLIEWYRPCTAPDKTAGSVAALVGIGGAGKTAIAERFTWTVPGMRNPRPDIPPGDGLRAPSGSLIYSFYSQPKPEVFFATLDNWIGAARTSTSRKVRMHSEVVDRLKAALKELPGDAHVLLVLDGLERIQDPSHGNTLGRLDDQVLTKLLDDVADGEPAYSGLLVLLTTRIPVESLEEGQRPFYKRVDVLKLEKEAAVALLRAHKVKGSYQELEQVAIRCGLHALTVDLTGGFIREFGDGDPKSDLKLPTPAELERLIEAEPDPDRREVLKQELRLARLASQYADTLRQKDPAALLLMQRLTTFHMQMPIDLLTQLFAGDDRLDRIGIEQRMRYLARLHLIDNDPDTKSASIHPAVREGFLTSMPDAEISQGHHAICSFLYEHLNLNDHKGLTLGGRPLDSLPIDKRNLDLVEELIIQLTQLGNISEAVSLFAERLGGFRRLGHEFEESSRGERICTTLIDAVTTLLGSKGVKAENWHLHLHDLHSARANFRIRQDRSFSDDIEKMVELAPLAAPESGHLLALCHSVTLQTHVGCFRKAVALRNELRLEVQKSESRVQKAMAFRVANAGIEALLLTGELRAARRATIDAYRAQRGSWSRPSWYDLHVFQHRRADVLVARGRLTAAEHILRRTGGDFARRLPSRRRRHPMATCCDGLAGVLIHQGKVDEARASLDYLDHPKGEPDPAATPGVDRRLELELVEFELHDASPDTAEHFEARLVDLNRRLREVRRSGRSAKWIELLVLRARLYLALGRTDKTMRDCQLALYGAKKHVGPHSELDEVPVNGPADVGDLSPNSKSPLTDAQVLAMAETDNPRGTFATPASGFPNLLAATHPHCGYKLGEWAARSVLARALLTEAAHALGRPGLSKDDLQRDDPAFRKLVERAVLQLDTVLAEQNDWSHPVTATARTLRADLEAGRFRVRVATVSSNETEASVAQGREVYRRLKDVHELLDIEYEKYHEFERAIAMAVGADQRAMLKLNFKRDIAPALRAREQEYAVLLASLPGLDPELKRADELVRDLSDATTAALTSEGVPAQAKEQLEVLKNALSDANAPSSAKLKASIQIIPGFLSYEFELEAGGVVRNAWTRATTYLKTIAERIYGRDVDRPGVCEGGRDH